jgi:hypothetical protein
VHKRSSTSHAPHPSGKVHAKVLTPVIINQTVARTKYLHRVPSLAVRRGDAATIQPVGGGTRREMRSLGGGWPHRIIDRHEFFTPGKTIPRSIRPIIGKREGAHGVAYAAKPAPAKNVG